MADSKKWSDQAIALIERYAQAATAPWTMEQFRAWAHEQGLAVPREHRSFGPVAQGAVRRGLIVRAGLAAAISSNYAKRATFRKAEASDKVNPLATPHNMQNYATVPEAGCWLWLGKRNMNGYGQLNGHGGTSKGSAHRLFYTELVGPIPPGLFVCHKCDTPSCVNPDHLFVGTHQDNMADMVKKGRHRGGKIKAFQESQNGKM